MKNVKKFLALLCTMAMVFSLFSGIVVADPITYTVTVADKAYIAGTVSTVAVTVKVGEAVTNNALTYTVNDGSADVAKGRAANGAFTIPVVFETGKDYTVTVVDDLGNTADSAPITADAIRAYDLQLDTIGTVTTEDTKTITGKVLDKDGKAVAGLSVALKDAAGTPNTVAMARTNNDGSFTMSAYFGKADLYTFYVDGVDYPAKTIAVSAKSALTVRSEERRVG